jgi:hypothetical protein
MHQSLFIWGGGRCFEENKNNQRCSVKRKAWYTRWRAHTRGCQNTLPFVQTTPWHTDKPQDLPPPAGLFLERCLMEECLDGRLYIYIYVVNIAILLLLLLLLLF